MNLAGNPWSRKLFKCQLLRMGFEIIMGRALKQFAGVFLEEGFTKGNLWSVCACPRASGFPGPIIRGTFVIAGHKVYGCPGRVCLR